MSTVLPNPNEPYTVPPHVNRVHLIVTQGELPPAVMALTHRSPVPIGLRIAGGCANMTTQDKETMLGFFAAGLHRFRGFISSGGTREVTADGQTNPMVTDVPAVLVANNPTGIVAVSTLPRTDDMGLVDESRLVFSPDGHVVPNPGVHMIVVVQSRSGAPLDWDGDLPTYFNLLDNLATHGKWRVGMVVYNGGGVTRKEALGALYRGWPTILVAGSGRQADVIIGELETSALGAEIGRNVDLHTPTIKVVPNGDTAALSRAAHELGLVA